MGERREQMDLRTRLADAVAASIRECPTPWHELPRSLEERIDIRKSVEEMGVRGVNLRRFK